MFCCFKMLLYIFLIVLFLLAVSAFIVKFTLDKKVIYKNLMNKHVVVTGGSSGIGKAAAVEAAKLGAHVTIIGRDESKLKSAVSEIIINCENKDTQKIQYSALDVTSDYNKIEQCFSALEANVGPIFMLINSAGMCICGKFAEMKVEDIKHMIDLNYFGSAYTTRTVLPYMKKRDEGIIVFVASEAALIGLYGYSAYSAGKWAVRGLAEAVSMELVGTNVRLMTSFPADTDTPGLKAEDLTKPEETKLISGTGGLHTPEFVGKQLIHDALNGKTYSVYSITGQLLITLFGSSIDGMQQILLQICSMGFLRMVMTLIVLSFHKLIRDRLKSKRLDLNQKNK